MYNNDYRTFVYYVWSFSGTQNTLNGEVVGNLHLVQTGYLGDFRATWCPLDPDKLKNNSSQAFDTFYYRGGYQARQYVDWTAPYPYFSWDGNYVTKGDYTPLNIVKIKNPTGTIMWADKIANGLEQETIFHQTGWNCLFVDGHVAYARMPDEYTAAHTAQAISGYYDSHPFYMFPVWRDLEAALGNSAHEKLGSYTSD
jgi:prepilin-type processing-associated H-X9-DG protein